MAAVAQPTHDASEVLVEECGSSDCTAEIGFTFDGGELWNLPPERSLISNGTCRTCDAPQHLVLWSTGERSGPWLELRRRARRH